MNFVKYIFSWPIVGRKNEGMFEDGNSIAVIHYGLTYSTALDVNVFENPHIFNSNFLMEKLIS